MVGDRTFHRNRHDLIRLPSTKADEAAELMSPDPEGTELDEQSNENLNDPSTSPTESSESTTPTAV